MVNADQESDAAQSKKNSSDMDRTLNRHFRWYEPEQRLVAPLIAFMVGVALLGLIVAHNREAEATGKHEAAQTESKKQQKQGKPSSQAGDGTFEIAEQGYSKLPGDDADTTTVSWGAVLTNTSKTHAVQGTLAFHALKGQWVNAQTPLLLPGESGAVGGDERMSPTDMGDAKFEVRGAEWWSMKDLDDPELITPSKPKSITMDEFQTGWQKQWEAKPELTQDIPEHDDTEDAYAVVRCRADSQYQGIADAELTVLWRDKDDKIVGGAHGEAKLPPGRSEHTVDMEYPTPEGIDESKVEVYGRQLPNVEP